MSEFDPEKEVYLGDGLYFSWDGFAFTLRAPREFGDHYVVLEPEVLAAFDNFRERVRDHYMRPKTSTSPTSVDDS